MSIIYASIGIRNSNVDDVKKSLEKLIGEKYSDLTILNGLLRLDVIDHTINFRLMGSYLASIKSDDSTPFFNDFDIDKFGLMIELSFVDSVDLYLKDMVELFTLLLGKNISKDLNREIIVLFENLTVPCALFHGGILKSNFSKYSSDFFRSKLWQIQL